MHLHKCRWITKRKWRSGDRKHVVEVCAVEGGGMITLWSRPDAMDVRAYPDSTRAEAAADRIREWLTTERGVGGWVDMTIT